MADADDFFFESNGGVELKIGGAPNPVRSAIEIRHEAKGQNSARLFSGEGGAAFHIIDERGDTRASLAANKAGESLSLGGQRPTVLLDGASASIQAGQADGQAGSLTLNAGGPKIVADAAACTVTVRSATGDDAFVIDANHDEGNGADRVRAVLGGPNRFGELQIQNDNASPTITLNGETGDIEFFNADFAEEFELAADATELALPGTVMAIRPTGDIGVCSDAYSTAAVGVVAGGGPYRPALVLDKRHDGNRCAVAMIGKVGCFADATTTPIRVGDLLTTSDTPGHAMAVTDPSRALGAVIGKALSPLDDGTGMIRVLVTLQ